MCTDASGINIIQLGAFAWFGALVFLAAFCNFSVLEGYQYVDSNQVSAIWQSQELSLIEY